MCSPFPLGGEGDKRREDLFYKVATIILLYSSIVGYDRLAIIFLGRGISIYGGLFFILIIPFYREDGSLNFILVLVLKDRSEFSQGLKLCQLREDYLDVTIAGIKDLLFIILVS